MQRTRLLAVATLTLSCLVAGLSCGKHAEQVTDTTQTVATKTHATTSANLTGTVATTATSIAECESKLGQGDYDVQITFMGINTFWRHDKDSNITVLIPDATAGRPSTPNPPRDKIPPHVAYVLADTDTLGAAGNNAPFEAAPNEGACYKFLRIDSREIAVDNTDVPMNINNSLCYIDNGQNDSCPTPGQTEGSLRWLPSVKNLLGGTPSQNMNHFDKDLSKGILAGFVDLDRGWLETVVTSPKTWAFRKNIGDADDKIMLPQVIPQEVRWHMRGKGSQFRLHLKDKTGADTTLAFTPVTMPDKTKRVVIVIGNNPECEIGPLKPDPNVLVDPHFRLYYEFVYNFPSESGPIPGAANKSLCGTYGPKDPTLKPGQHLPTCKSAGPPCGKTIVDAKTSIVPAGHALAGGMNCGGNQWP